MERIGFSNAIINDKYCSNNYI